jgi:hypothetical protein
MTLAARREALELAERAHALVHANPLRAHALAERALATALAAAQAGLRADQSALAGFLCLGVG